MNRYALTLTLVLMAAPPCAAGAIAQTRGAARLEVHFDSKDAKIALADVIDVKLTVEGNAELLVNAPLELPTTAPWVLLQRSAATREKIGPGHFRWRLSYRFAPREPGHLEFAFPEVSFRNGADAEQSVSWTAIPFTVTIQGGDLCDITAVEEVPLVVPPDGSWQIFGVVGGSGLLLIALLFALRRLLRNVMPKTPAERALREWERLAALKLPERGRSERFITLLTTVVRRYLERQYALPARRRTTPEFVRVLAQTAALSAPDKQFLTRFLERCDAVKFAGTPMPVDECDHWAQAARRFLSGGPQVADRHQPEA